MFSKISINSSSKSSTSSAFKVKDIINKWENNTIAACVLGISKIGNLSNYTNKVAHSALLLLDRNIEYEEEEDEIQKEVGILIEYGDYKPNMCDTEKEYVEKGFVTYHYGEKGGLRYYGKKYDEFIKEFGDIGYIDLNIHADNQMTFNAFLDKIAKSEDNKWIKEKYYVDVIWNNNFNCQNFTIEAIQVLKPSFSFVNIFPASSEFTNIKSYKKKLNFMPPNIKDVLLNYYIKL